MHLTIIPKTLNTNQNSICHYYRSVKIKLIGRHEIFVFLVKVI